jgi:hypothetical protein
MADVDGGQLLADIERRDPKLGQLLRTRVIRGINNLGQNLGADPVGFGDAPNPPNGVQVKVSGEYAHVQIQDNNQLNKHVRYFTEVSTNPQFSQPIVIDHGASRTSHPFPLPSNDDGGTPHTYYFRSYSQYPGSKPSAPVVHGGINPIGTQMTGSTNMTLLPSTGSGTAAGDGQSGGSGLGKVLIRPTPAPKRKVG